MNTKKVIVKVNILILLIIICGGCMKIFFKKSDEEIVEEKFLNIVKSIQKKDRESLKSMFSKRALSETENFDESLEYIFNLFEGEIINWEIIGGPTIGESNEGNKRTKHFVIIYNVETNKQKYIFLLIDNIIDDYNKDNIGLYTLRIIKAENEDTEFGYWQDMELPGIYMPEVVK